MLVDILVCLAGLAFDHTLITGAPAWLKPLNFGISVAIFCFTVAFLMDFLPKTGRLAQRAGMVMALALTAEIVLIDMQAARHTTSHFNISSPFDTAVWASMGAGIALVVMSTIALTWSAFAARFEDAALGWVMRLSLIILLAGMFTGGLMTQPTPSQMAQVKAGRGMPIAGAHTVGAPDGGPGLPVTNWSVDHGDLRVAHFAGFHAMQLLLAVWLITKGRARWPAGRRIRLILTVAASYAMAFVVLLWQALRGQPLLNPDSLTLEAWAAWIMLTGIVLAWTLFPRDGVHAQVVRQL
jgi:hypothetical protein